MPRYFWPTLLFSCPIPIKILTIPEGRMLECFDTCGLYSLCQLGYISGFHFSWPAAPQLLEGSSDSEDLTCSCLWMD